MHYGETETAASRRAATPTEVRDLLDEGIEVLPCSCPRPASTPCGDARAKRTPPTLAPVWVALRCPPSRVAAPGVTVGTQVSIRIAPFPQRLVVQLQGWPRACSRRGQMPPPRWLSSDGPGAPALPAPGSPVLQAPQSGGRVQRTIHAHGGRHHESPPASSRARAQMKCAATTATRGLPGSACRSRLPVGSQPLNDQRLRHFAHPLPRLRTGQVVGSGSATTTAKGAPVGACSGHAQTGQGSIGLARNVGRAGNRANCCGWGCFRLS